MQPALLKNGGEKWEASALKLAALEKDWRGNLRSAGPVVWKLSRKLEKFRRALARNHKPPPPPLQKTR